MNEILLNILSVVVTAVILPLISYAGTRLISYLNSKIKDEKARELLTQATGVVTNAVRAVFQTYVDSLKKSGNFGAEAQLEALNKALKLFKGYSREVITAVEIDTKYSGYLARQQEQALQERILKRL